MIGLFPSTKRIDPRAGWNMGKPCDMAASAISSVIGKRMDVGLFALANGLVDRHLLEIAARSDAPAWPLRSWLRISFPTLFAAAGMILS